MSRETFLPPPPEGIGEHLSQLWIKHFRKRDEAEGNHFAGQTCFDFETRTLTVESGELNSAQVVDFIRSMELEAAMIFGVDIIVEPLFSALPDYKVNLHLGLIPHYKGSITMFWPFYLLEPNVAGCTYHVIDRRVDTGHILHQVVPRLERGDGMHDVACKACLAAYDEVGLVLEHIKDRVEKGIRPDPDPTLAKRGKIFTKKDFHPAMLRVNYELFDDDVVDHYLDGKINPRKVKLKKLEAHRREPS
jgi:folate-dependent phosphoribosylglycinamide formyltransferase PurN